MTSLDSLPGAVADDNGGVLHFGQPIREQRTFARGALVPVAREVLQLTGPDRQSWLDSITSQQLQLAPGESTEDLLLSPNGKIEQAMKLVDDGESLWIIVDPGARAALAEFLLRMRFMRQVEIIERDDLAVVGVSGDLEPPAGVTWRDSWPNVVDGGVRYGDYLPDADWQWAETIVAADAELSADAVAGSTAYEAARIAAGRPSAADIDDRAIPHELDWLTTAVHLTKGCYRGQETVAKVHNLGAPPRRITLLHLDGSDSVMPVPGAEVRLGDKQVGHITSSAYHHELGPIALALLKRATDPEAQLTVLAGDDGTHAITAAQEVLVPQGAGHANKPPRLPRLGAVKRPPNRQ